MWISGYLDSGKNNLSLHPHSEILCGASLPFVQERSTSLVFRNLKQCVVNSSFCSTGIGYIEAD